MADIDLDAPERIKPKTMLIAGIGLVVVVALGFVASEIFWTPKPPPPEPIAHAMEDERPKPLPAAPATGTLDERVRGFFQNIGTGDCLTRHLPKDARVDGVAEFVMAPDGTISDVQMKTDPTNAGVALCVQQLLAHGFTFDGQPMKVSYTFNGRWDEHGRLAFGQNTRINP